jgi:hypothetical protein
MAKETATPSSKTQEKINLTKLFDIAFAVGVVTWILFAWVLPSLFNTDNDVTMWMVFLLIGLVIYGTGRFVLKLIGKLISAMDLD